jgi:hypothetical protein
MTGRMSEDSKHPEPQPASPEPKEPPPPFDPDPRLVTVMERGRKPGAGERRLREYVERAGRRVKPAPRGRSS